jgi:predicted transcriptional regulator
MKVEKRHKYRIYFEILMVLSHARGEDTLRTTYVARKVNIAYDRFLRHLEELENLGMIESREKLFLTEKGKQYVDEYQRFDDFLRRMGLVVH